MNPVRSKVLFAASMLTFVLAVAVALIVGYLIQDQSEDARVLCERTVANRDDARAMFTWIAEAFPSADFTAAMVTELDVRLPRLECIDNVAVPRELRSEP